MEQLPLNVLYHGADEPLPEGRLLHAGPLTVVYEDGKLRHIRSGPGEVLRQVYMGVRDQDWHTPQPRLSNLHIEEGSASFRIRFDAETRQDAVDFVWQGTITGEESGTITFSMEGEARSTFLRNRIGLCVLHPIDECAGAPFTALKVDGSVEWGIFPRYISPNQPMFDMAAISYEVLPGVTADIVFSGDVFEMEDQRNWTDYTFKSYSSPLRLPIPVEITAGTRVRQSVRVSVHGQMPALPAGAEAPPTLTLGPAPMARFPRLGLGLPIPPPGIPSTAGNIPREDDATLRRLRALHLSHLRVDLPLQDDAFRATLQQAAAQSRAIGAPLEIALFLSGDAEAELQRLLEALDQVKPAVCTWLVFYRGEKVTAPQWVELARRYLAGCDTRARFGAGTNGYFVEINRNRPAEPADLLCFSVNPQVHTFDNGTMVENLQGQGAQVRTAGQFAFGTPVALTPITIKPRFNEVTGRPRQVPGELPSSVDPRQMSLFGAAWTAGSLKYIAEAGTYSATYYQTAGWEGVVAGEAPSPLPDRFPSLPGCVYPLYHVLADVGEMAGGDVIPVSASDALAVNGLAIRKDGRLRMLAANMTAQPQHATIVGLENGTAMARRLDETTAMQAMQSPEDFRSSPGEAVTVSDGRMEVDLLPYAVVRIDL